MAQVWKYVEPEDLVTTFGGCWCMPVSPDFEPVRTDFGKGDLLAGFGDSAQISSVEDDFCVKLFGILLGVEGL